MAAAAVSASAAPPARDGVDAACVAAALRYAPRLDGPPPPAPCVAGAVAAPPAAGAQSTTVAEPPSRRLHRAILADDFAAAQLALADLQRAATATCADDDGEDDAKPKRVGEGEATTRLSANERADAALTVSLMRGDPAAVAAAWRGAAAATTMRQRRQQHKLEAKRQRAETDEGAPTATAASDSHAAAAGAATGAALAATSETAAAPFPPLGLAVMPPPPGAHADARAVSQWALSAAALGEPHRALWALCKRLCSGSAGLRCAFTWRALAAVLRTPCVPTAAAVPTTALPCWDGYYAAYVAAAGYGSFGGGGADATTPAAGTVATSFADVVPPVPPRWVAATSAAAYVDAAIVRCLELKDRPCLHEAKAVKDAVFPPPLRPAGGDLRGLFVDASFAARLFEGVDPALLVVPSDAASEGGRGGRADVDGPEAAARALRLLTRPVLEALGGYRDPRTLWPQ